MSRADQNRAMSSPPSRSIALVIAFTLAVGGLVVSGITGIVGGVVGAILAVGAGGSGSGAAAALLVVALLIASEAGFVVVGYAFRRTDDGAEIPIDWIAPEGPTARDAALIVGAVLALVAVNRTGFWLGSLVGIDPVTAVSPPGEGSIAIFALLVPTMLLAVGPAEEYLFRGVIQGYLADSFSPWGAVGWSATLFALVHLPNLVSNPDAAPVSVPLWLTVGVALGWLYQRTEALLVPVAVHGLYNVVVMAFLFAELGVL